MRFFAHNKYTQLAANTALFAASSLAAKLAALALTRFYTGAMGQAGYGLLDLATACANLAIPLASLGMSHAVIRFGLDDRENRAAVFTTGFALTGAGCLAAACVLPLALGGTALARYAPCLAGYVAVSCVRNCLSQSVRAAGKAGLYAADGALNAVYLLGFTFVFMHAYHLGLGGYLLAVLLADACSALQLSLFGALWPLLRRRFYSGALARRMLRYALPLVPASLLWWVVTASDRFLLVWLCGAGANGLYAVACKVPALVSLFSTVFTEAWQLSAFSKRPHAEQAVFFNHVFSGLTFVVYLGCSALMLLAKPVIHLLAAPDFGEAAQFVPVLLVGSFFLCLSSFLNSVYLLEKRAASSLFTMAAGAAFNILLNLLLIPSFGPFGAGAGTAGAYALVCCLRLASSRRTISLRKQAPLLAVATLALTVQSLLATHQNRGLFVLTAMFVLLNCAVFGARFRGALRARFGGAHAKK